MSDICQHHDERYRISLITICGHSAVWSVSLSSLNSKHDSAFKLSFYSFIHLFVETDVIQDQSNPCKFFFYEVYIDIDAVLFHKEQPHFALWTDFKASGGVVANTSHKCDGVFMSE